MRRQAIFREAAQQQRLLTPENPGLRELVQHALDAVRVLAHVLDKQDAAADLRHIRRADQCTDHGKVSTPQHAPTVDRIG